ncbi:hypothetical protein HHK36_029865 [Tetracentron sinense]|uniref:Uncharacterized protein n=1 Tax=Tetracentron sinense TaxID=13715 RepID=A0A835D001_TETSI|nr:hypothetical protein HHK36_029865 [Tetracentron sinense]
MDSGSSFATLESIIEEGPVLEIEMIGNSPAASNHGLDLGTQGEEANATELNILENKFTTKWAKIIIIMSFTGVLSLIGVSYYINNGKLIPEAPFKQHSASFLLFLIVLMIIFYIAIIGIVFGEELPVMGKTCNIISLVLFILSFTVLLWAFLPQKLSWAPWVLFAVTISAILGVLSYKSCLQRMKILKGQTGFYLRPNTYLFDKAEEIIGKMLMRPDAVILKALLGACRIHRNIKMVPSVVHVLGELWPPVCKGLTGFLLRQQSTISACQIHTLMGHEGMPPLFGRGDIFAQDMLVFTSGSTRGMNNMNLLAQCLDGMLGQDAWIWMGRLGSAQVRVGQDSGSYSTTLESILEEDPVQVIEMNGNSPAASNRGLELGTQREEANAAELHILDKKFTTKWAKIIIVMSFTGLLSLLSLSYTIDNGKFIPEAPFKQHSASLLMFLIVLMIVFYIAIIGVVFGEALPVMSITCNFIALVLFILSFTVLLWAFLPQNLSWAPWVLFAVTIFKIIGVLFYKYHLQACRF